METVAAVPRRERIAAGAVALGGLVVGVGSVLPWSRLASGGETRVFSGVTVGDGRTCLLLGIALIILAGPRAAGRPLSWSAPLGALALAAVILLLTLADFAFGPAPLASFRAISAGLIELRPKIGIAVTFVGGLLAAVGAVLLTGSAGRAGTTGPGRGGARSSRPWYDQ